MKKANGYLMVDHRASPGLPEDVARAVGYDPKLCGEGKVYEADSLYCVNCYSHVIKNPLRTRERGSYKGQYVCDGCAYLLSQPDYVHVPIAKLIDDVKSTQGSSLELLLNKGK